MLARTDFAADVWLGIPVDIGEPGRLVAGQHVFVAGFFVLFHQMLEAAGIRSGCAGVRLGFSDCWFPAGFVEAAVLLVETGDGLVAWFRAGRRCRCGVLCPVLGNVGGRWKAFWLRWARLGVP